MKRVRQWLLMVVVIAMAGLILSWTGYAQKQGAAKIQWEYKVVFVDDAQGSKISETEKMLNDLGAQGWELVQYRPLSAELAGSFHFKRQK